ERWGDEQVHQWRRSYDTAPPGGESLKDTLARALPYYVHHILPDVLAGKRVLVSAHGNSLRALIMAIKGDVEGGATLAEALARHPLYFDDLFVNLVEAGEQAGALETLLDKIAMYKEKTEAIKKKIKKALTYPIAVLVIAFIVTAVLLIFVIPQFEELFKGFGADLPAFTQMVVDLSYFVRDKGFLIVIGGAGIGSTFTYFKKRSRKFREFLDRVALKIPVVGDILVKASIARFARTLSTMFSAGVPLVEALQSVAGATGNITYELGVLQMRDQVATGQQLNLAMEQTGLFPNMVVQMIAIGEESGSIDTMAAKVADFFEAEVDDAVDNLSSLMEPMIMAVLGVLVGGLVVAMYMPIFKMGAVV
ncbi:MAG: type II secretion system F family protein, partial [Proteobacteria bacterium]|nr:type II secretion system F family protein [Pseudomonadota bacterium]